jgi:hypothetical protein
MSQDAREKPEGWFWPITPVAPPRLLGGERAPVIWSAIIAAGFGLQVAPKVTGALWWIPTGWVVAGAAIAFWFIALGVLYRCWCIDPWMSGTLFRFMRWPKFIPSHASWASSEFLRCGQRKLEHFKR